MNNNNLKDQLVLIQQELKASLEKINQILDSLQSTNSDVLVKYELNNSPFKWNNTTEFISSKLKDTDGL